MSDLTPIYLELVRSKHENLTPLDRHKLQEKQQIRSRSNSIQNNTDIFTQECLKVVSLF